MLSFQKLTILFSNPSRDTVPHGAAVLDPMKLCIPGHQQGHRSACYLVFPSLGLPDSSFIYIPSQLFLQESHES